MPDLSYGAQAKSQYGNGGFSQASPSDLAGALSPLDALSKSLVGINERTQDAISNA